MEMSTGIAPVYDGLQPPAYLASPLTEAPQTGLEPIYTELTALRFPKLATEAYGGTSQN